MNIIKLCTCCLGGVLLSTASIGMREVNLDALKNVYRVDQTITAKKCMDNRQIRAQYRQGTNGECSQNKLDNELINCLRKEGIWVSCITRTTSMGPEEQEEREIRESLGRRDTYKRIDDWLNHRFPTGENGEEMKRRYGAYIFSYTPGSCNSLKMDITSNDGEKSTSVVLDKNGWPILLNMNGTVYLPGNLYYDGNVYLRGRISFTSTSEVSLWEME